jgi:hypothetical protein
MPGIRTLTRLSRRSRRSPADRCSSCRPGRESRHRARFCVTRRSASSDRIRRSSLADHRPDSCGISRTGRSCFVPAIPGLSAAGHFALSTSPTKRSPDGEVVSLYDQTSPVSESRGAGRPR